MASNLNLTIKNVGTINKGLHDTKGMGFKPNLTGTAGSGDWVDRKELIPRLYVEWDAFGSDLFAKHSLFLNLIGMNQSVVADKIGLPNFALGNQIDISWEAPAVAQSLTEFCEIPVQEVGIKQCSIGTQEGAGGAIGIRCGCTPTSRCNNGPDHRYSRDHFRNKVSEIVASAMNQIDAKIFEKIKADVTKVVSGNYINRHLQITRGLAELADTLANGDATSQDLGQLPLRMNQFRYAILANAFTIMDLQNTPGVNVANTLNPDAGSGYAHLTSMGYKGTIQGIPVFEVPSNVVDEATGWMIVPLDNIVMAVGCEGFWETPDAVYDNTKNVVKVQQTKFAYRIIYGIEDISFFLDGRLVGMKGKALLPAPVGAIATYQTAAPATPAPASAPVAETKVKKAKA